MVINLHSFSKLAFSIFIIFGSSFCLAGIYKWVDEKGNVHYSQQRPVDTSVEKMDVQMHAPRDASSYKRPGDKDKEENSEEDPENPQDPDAKDETAKKEEPKPPAETAAEKKNRLAACAQARKTLSTMQNSGRVRSKDKDGNITYLSDEQKNARMKTTRELIKKRCK